VCVCVHLPAALTVPGKVEVVCVESLQGRSVADGDVGDVHHTALFVPTMVSESDDYGIREQRMLCLRVTVLTAK
jgi:hypothetical protein